jgi:hypothetical protein
MVTAHRSFIFTNVLTRIAVAGQPVASNEWRKFVIALIGTFAIRSGEAHRMASHEIYRASALSERDNQVCLIFNMCN